MYPCDFRHLRGKKPATPATFTILSNQGHDAGTPARTTIGVQRGKGWKAVVQLPEELFCYHSPLQPCPPCAWYCARHVCPWDRPGAGMGWGRAGSLTLGHHVVVVFLTKKKTEPQALLCVQLHYHVTRMFCSACESTGRGQSLRTHSAPGRHRRCYI